MDGTECQILLDTRASKSFMSKSHYLHCKSLYSLPKDASKVSEDPGRKWWYVGILFIIPIIVDIHGHRFKVCTIESKIHENVDIVLEIKKFKPDRIINS